MSSASYYAFAAVFIISVLLTAFAAIRSNSWLRFVAPVSVLLSVLVGYFGLDHFLGSPKPIAGQYLWSGPAYGDCGATVRGATIGSSTLWLMLDEDGAAEPRLFSFPSTPELLRGLKQAIKTHSEKTGQQFGFMFGATKQCEEGMGVGGRKSGSGRGKDHSQGMQGASDADTPGFAEPVTRAPPPKE